MRPLISSSTVLFFSMHNAQDAFILPPNPTLSALLSGPEPDTDGLHRPSSLLPGFQGGSANGRSGRRSEVRRKEGWRYICTIVSPLAGLYLLTMADFHVGNSAKSTALAFPSRLSLSFMPRGSNILPHLLAQSMLHHPMLISLSPDHTVENSPLT